jgi:hypothetical protein
MDKAVFIPSAFLGLIFIVIYWYRCTQARKEFNQAIMVNAVLQASGIVCGLLLVAGTINEEARKMLNEIDLYIFISGLVVVAASVKGIHKDIFMSTSKKRESTKPSNKA